MQDNPNLQGQIPPDIRNLVKLERLRFGNTQVGGTLPAEFFWITTLKDFLVPRANFQGEMSPVQWLNFTNLEELDIAFNQFRGPVPNIFDEIPRLGEYPGDCFSIANGRLSHMNGVVEILRLQGNDLTGTLEADICEQRGSKIGDIQVLVVDSDIACPGNCCESCDTLDVCETKGLMEKDN